MKVLFVLPRMVSGGVERVTLSLIAELGKSGHECALALRSARGELLGEAHSLTDVHVLAPNGLQQFVPNLARLIKRWSPTHVVTAFADVAVMAWFAMHLAGTCPRWIHGVHNTHAPVIRRNGVWGVARYWLGLRLAAFVYRHADAVVAVSEGVRAEILGGFGVASERVTTIYNPVVPGYQLREVIEPRHDPSQPFSIVAVGRLTRQKGFDVLIRAMASVPPPWRLNIWGEGEERAHLETLIDQQGMQQLIHLRGYCADPYVLLRSADLFVLSSRYEGLPTVLIEALACQCRIVATDCPHGPREILLGGELGTSWCPRTSTVSRLPYNRGSLVMRTRIPGGCWRVHEILRPASRDPIGWNCSKRCRPSGRRLTQRVSLVVEPRIIRVVRVRARAPDVGAMV